MSASVWESWSEGAREYWSSRLLKNRVILTEGADAGDRVISEARGIWSLFKADTVIGPTGRIT